MIPRRYTVMLLLWLAWVSTSGQTFHNYTFTTGVDSTKWIALSNPDTLLTYDSVNNSSFVQLDFPFSCLGVIINNICVSRIGRVYSNGTNMDPHSGLNNSAITDPMFEIYGRLEFGSVRCSAVYQTVGSPGNRTMVFEISRKLAANMTGASHYQLQFDECTDVVRFVYGSNTVSNTHVTGQIGFTGSNASYGSAYGRYICVDPIYHSASTNEFSNTLQWPGNYRYYEFAPLCSPLVRINVRHVEANSATVSWTQAFGDSISLYFGDSYLVRYGCPNCGYREFSTTDTMVRLVGLQQSTSYEVQIWVVCRNGDTSEVEPFSFSTATPTCSNIPYTSLYSADFVECRIGTFFQPSTSKGVIDYGYESNVSRHTIHFDTSERDPRTGNMLRTVPPGRCASVRLGNWNNGAEQEDITYTLHVDTNVYDLLILRYAIVEENPGHLLEKQPHVIFSVTDSAGNLIDSCYHANFISGNLSGWNEYYYNMQMITWRDWAAFGVSLSEFHGQDIRVTISNFDCAHGGHFGYTYFTLEGAMKRLESSVCGANVGNTFRAPQGFNYRWYSAANPSLTLSTADTLHVAAAGIYYCQASYQLSERNCNFTLSTRAGARYPVAQFSSYTDDSCSAVRHFVNQSVVAIDAAHTQLTDEPCERYLWRFSDGTVDSATHVVRTFGNGTYTVTLFAMLANGTCVDSTTQTFTISIPSDTVSDTLCWGETYLFYRMAISEPGRYSYIEDCFEHLLFYNVFFHPTNISDTICQGDTLFFGQHICVNSGIFSQVYTDQYGCDSIVKLRLSCMPSYHFMISDTLPVGEYYAVGDTAFMAPGKYRYMMQTIYGCDSLLEISLSCTVQRDTTVCTTSLPLVWEGHSYTAAGSNSSSYTNQAGTDSIVVYMLHVREPAMPQWTLDQSCDSGRYFIVEVGGGYRYQWYTDVAGSSIDVIVADSLYYIYPLDSILYYLQADYAEGLSCPAIDSIYLNPADLLPVSIDFSVTPERLTAETPTVTLLDQSQNILSRQWYVNGMLQPATASQIECSIPFSYDSMEVCLVGYRTLCYQSLCKSIPIEKRTIYFPNVFTPDGDINNRFTAIGMGIAEFEMWIYDRRGALMFHTTDMQQGWDGTSKGIKCRQEAYAYICRYRLKQEQGYQTHTGTVLLLR